MNLHLDDHIHLAVRAGPGGGVPPLIGRVHRVTPPAVPRHVEVAVVGQARHPLTGPVNQRETIFSLSFTPAAAASGQLHQPDSIKSACTGRVLVYIWPLFILLIMFF